MNLMTKSLFVFSVSCFACGGLAWSQDKAMTPPMSKGAMAAKKKMMEPTTKEMVKKNMMSKDSMLPDMVSKEMVKEEMAQDAETRGMIRKEAMMAGEKSMARDDKKMMADEKMMAEPTATQKLFEELVARHIAAKKVAMMKKSDKTMMSSGAMAMKSMAMDGDKMKMMASETATSEDAAKMIAREELIQSLMLDKEVMALVEEMSKMADDPAMAPMMSDEKMMKSGEMMAKDKSKASGMMKEVVTREMVSAKNKMMDDKKSKK